MEINQKGDVPAVAQEFRYKAQHSVSERRRETEQIRQANPDCVPVVCQAVEGDVCDSAPYHLFLISADSTLSSLADLLREKLNTTRGMIITINGRTFQGGNEMSSLHNVYKDAEDDLLYVMFSTVDTSFPVVEAVIAVVSLAGLGLLAYKLVARRGTPVAVSATLKE